MKNIFKFFRELYQNWYKSENNHMHQLKNDMYIQDDGEAGFCYRCVICYKKFKQI